MDHKLSPQVRDNRDSIGYDSLNAFPKKTFFLGHETFYDVTVWVRYLAIFLLRSAKRHVIILTSNPTRWHLGIIRDKGTVNCYSKLINFNFIKFT